MTIKKHKTREQLLHLLSDGSFHSGEDLGKQLGLTRAAIWKSIKQLEALGIEVESISGKGYRVPNGLDILKETSIRHLLSAGTESKIKEMQILDEVDSTNDYLLSQINTAEPKNIACFSERQTKGRGRRGREWVSPFANNIYHSLLWYFDKDPTELMGLSLAVAVMVSRALNNYGIQDGLELKWPNDIFWQSQKLSGILIEMMGEPHEACAVVIGIGINTRLSDEKIETLNRPVTSIEKITGRQANRNQLAGLLLNSLIEGLQQFENDGLSPFLKEWRALDKFRGKMVTLSSVTRSITGIMQDVSERGELLLSNNEGDTQRYLSGEVSLTGQS